MFEIERDMETLNICISRQMNGYGFDFKVSSINKNDIIVNEIQKNKKKIFGWKIKFFQIQKTYWSNICIFVYTNCSNQCKVGDKMLTINDIDAGMINIDDLQSMLETPGKKTIIVIERLVPVE